MLCWRRKASVNASSLASAPVRAGRGLPGRCARGLYGQDRHIAPGRQRCGFGQQPGIAQGFGIHQDQAQRRVFEQAPHGARHIHVGLIARGHHVAHAQALAAQSAIQDARAGAALADDGDGAVLRGALVDHRGKVQHGAGLKVRNALRIRAYQSETGCAGPPHQRLLRGKPGCAQFRKARRVDHRAARTGRYALRQRSIDLAAGQTDDHQIGRLRQISQTGVARQALHLGAPGVDRVDVALKAVAAHVGNRPAAGLDGVVGSAEHGDTARRQQLQHGCRFSQRSLLPGPRCFSICPVRSPRRRRIAFGPCRRGRRHCP